MRESPLSDKKFFNTTENTWEAEEHTYSDYYPFGLTIKERSQNTAGYRYGFNSKENDGDFGMASGIQDERVQFSEKTKQPVAV